MVKGSKGCTPLFKNGVKTAWVKPGGFIKRGLGPKLYGISLEGKRGGCIKKYGNCGEEGGDDMTHRGV